jgi:hypothetical protein
MYNYVTYKAIIFALLPVLGINDVQERLFSQAYRVPTPTVATDSNRESDVERALGVA